MAPILDEKDVVNLAIRWEDAKNKLTPNHTQVYVGGGLCLHMLTFRVTLSVAAVYALVILIREFAATHCPMHRLSSRIISPCCHGHCLLYPALGRAEEGWPEKWRSIAEKEGIARNRSDGIANTSQ